MRPSLLLKTELRRLRSGPRLDHRILLLLVRMSSIPIELHIWRARAEHTFTRLVALPRFQTDLRAKRSQLCSIPLARLSTGLALVLTMATDWPTLIRIHVANAGSCTDASSLIPFQR